MIYRDKTKDFLENELAKEKAIYFCQILYLNWECFCLCRKIYDIDFIMSIMDSKN